jgi:hypothetical protein
LQNAAKIGKAGKGALSGIHPQQLSDGAAGFAIAPIDTADVDDIIWGTVPSAVRRRDLGRMSALDADTMFAPARHPRSFLRLWHYQRQYGRRVHHVGRGRFGHRGAPR